MRKGVLLTLTLVISFLCACGQVAPSYETSAPSEIAPTTPEPTTSPIPTPVPTPIDENILGKRITTPISFFEYVGEDVSDLDAFAQKFGFIRAIDNGDGTITIVTTRGHYKEFMATLQDAVEQYYLEIGPEVNIYCVKSISHNKDFTEIEVAVDRNLYVGFQQLLVTPAVMMVTYFYMAFADQDDRTPTLTIVDAETGEIIAVHGVE